MTEDEKRQQKAMVMLEYHEADQNLAHLEAKTARLSEKLAAVSKWLNQASKRHESLSDEVFSGIRSVNILTDPEVATAMDFGAALALMKEIKDGRALVDDLYKRKKSLGLQ